MGMGPIPFFAMMRYGREELDLDGDDLDRFADIIRRLDNEYLGMVGEQTRKATKKKAK
jgi:hypothetical protein